MYFGLLKKTPNQKHVEAYYKKFLQGELYPEIKVTHTRADGTVTNKRLKDNTDFFNQGKTNHDKN